MNMNVVLLIGRMTRDPELRYVAQGHAMATFTVAVDRDYPNGDGEREADFIAVVAWRTRAEQVGEYGARGRLVGVHGRLQTRSHEAADASRRRVTEVVASQVRFLDRRPQEMDGQETPAEQPVTAEVGEQVPAYYNRPAAGGAVQARAPGYHMFGP